MSRSGAALEAILAATADFPGRSGDRPGAVVGPTPSFVSNRFARIGAAFLSRTVANDKIVKILAKLDESGLIEADAIASASANELIDVLAEAKLALAIPAAKLLVKIAAWYVDLCEDDSNAIDDASTSRLRDSLIAIKGLGAATADAILLFGLDRPAYPVDRSTYRIFVRHGYFDSSVDYDEARSTIEALAHEEPALLATLSIRLEAIGRDFCKPAAARCERCPLAPLLPERGPYEIDS